MVRPAHQGVRPVVSALVGRAVIHGALGTIRMNPGAVERTWARPSATADVIMCGTVVAYVRSCVIHIALLGPSNESQPRQYAFEERSSTLVNEAGVCFGMAKLAMGGTKVPLR